MLEQQQTYDLPVEPERQLIFSIHWIVWVVLLFVGLGWSTYDVIAKRQGLIQRPFDQDSAVGISAKLAKEAGRDPQLVSATFRKNDADFKILAAGNAHQIENWSWQKTRFSSHIARYFRRDSIASLPLSQVNFHAIQTLLDQVPADVRKSFSFSVEFSQENLFLLPDSVKRYYRRNSRQHEGMIWVWQAQAISETRGIVTIVADRNGKIIGQEEL